MQCGIRIQIVLMIFYFHSFTHLPDGADVFQCFEPKYIGHETSWDFKVIFFMVACLFNPNGDQSWILALGKTVRTGEKIFVWCHSWVFKRSELKYPLEARIIWRLNWKPQIIMLPSNLVSDKCRVCAAFRGAVQQLDHIVVCVTHKVCLFHNASRRRFIAHYDSI